MFLWGLLSSRFDLHVPTNTITRNLVGTSVGQAVISRDNAGRRCDTRRAVMTTFRAADRHRSHVVCVPTGLPHLQRQCKPRILPVCHLGSESGTFLAVCDQDPGVAFLLGSWNHSHLGVPFVLRQPGTALCLPLNWGFGLSHCAHKLLYLAGASPSITGLTHHLHLEQM